MQRDPDHRRPGKQCGQDDGAHGQQARAAVDDVDTLFGLGGLLFDEGEKTVEIVDRHVERFQRNGLEIAICSAQLTGIQLLDHLLQGLLISRPRILIRRQELELVRVPGTGEIELFRIGQIEAGFAHDGADRGELTEIGRLNPALGEQAVGGDQALDRAQRFELGQPGAANVPRNAADGVQLDDAESAEADDQHKPHTKGEAELRPYAGLPEGHPVTLMPASTGAVQTPPKSPASCPLMAGDVLRICASAATEDC